MRDLALTFVLLTHGLAAVALLLAFSLGGY